MTTNAIVHTSDATFEDDVLKSEIPVLLDLWAEWCGPCRSIAPSLEELAVTYGAKLRIAKLDIDQNPATPARFNVRSIPTLILFNNGVVQATTVGSRSKSQLAAFIDANLAELA